MRTIFLSVLISVNLWPVTVSAAELTLSIVRAGDGVVQPGAVVNYEIRGLITGTTDSGGLAFWSADLAFGGAAVAANHTSGAAPATSPMNSFVKNAGFTNPAGYGGTVVGTSVVQIGGGQNTIGNTANNAPFPVGTSVNLNVAHSTQVLASGSYQVPWDADPGEQHTLTLTRPMASVINTGQGGAPYQTRAINVNLSPAALTIGTPPEATVTGAVTRKNNASGPGGFCDLSLMPAVSSEPHQSQITEVRITFDVAPGDPPGTASGVTLEQKTCAVPTYAAYSGASTSSATVAGNTLVLSFAPALENARTYRITVGPDVTALTGQYVEFRGLFGDVNSDGFVNTIDRSVVVGVWGGSGFSCETDVNSDGATNSMDRSLVVSAWTSPANCAP